MGTWEFWIVKGTCCTIIIRGIFIYNRGTAEDYTENYEYIPDLAPFNPIRIEYAEKKAKERTNYNKNYCEGAGYIDTQGTIYSPYEDWMTKPAKKDIFDKFLDLITGDHSPKTQLEQVMVAQFSSMQVDQTLFLQEMSSDFTVAMRGAASAGRLSEMPGMNILPGAQGTKLKQNRMQSAGSTGKAFKVTENPYDLLRQHGIPTTLTDDEIRAANAVGLRMQAEGTGNLGISKITKDSPGQVIFGELDNLGRPTGVMATITKETIGTGSKASQSILPPGFLGGGPGSPGHARGHLLGNQLGGSGKD